jgi:hypothetical protein
MSVTADIQLPRRTGRHCWVWGTQARFAAGGSSIAGAGCRIYLCEKTGIAEDAFRLRPELLSFRRLAYEIKRFYLVEGRIETGGSGWIVLRR